MGKKKFVEAITSRDEDFARWYTDVCTKAELMDYSEAKGFIIYRPYGYALWENIKDYLDKEKIILALGNVEGVSAVDDQMNVLKSEPAAVFYEVKSGDTLSKIAKAHYGNAQKYMEIFEANKPLLKDPNKIYPGQVLRIPSLEE